MTWDRKAAWKAAGFDKLIEENKNMEKSKAKKTRKKRTRVQDIYNQRKKIRLKK